MSLRFKPQGEYHCFFVTTAFNSHQPFGNTAGMYEQLALSLSFCLQKYSACMAAYVFMPTHLHFLLFINGKLLGSLMRDFKKYIAQKAAKDLGINANAVWSAGYDRLAIDVEQHFLTKLQYIHNNPTKAGLCGTNEHWPWSSAADYLSDRQGPLPIDKSWMG